MVVRVTGFENVVVKINYICQCECALPQNTVGYEGILPTKC